MAEATGVEMDKAKATLLAIMDREYSGFSKGEWCVILGAAIVDLIAQAPDPARSFEGQVMGMATYLEILVG